MLLRSNKDGQGQKKQTKIQRQNADLNIGMHGTPLDHDPTLTHSFHATTQLNHWEAQTFNDIPLNCCSHQQTSNVVLVSLDSIQKQCMEIISGG